MTEKTSVKLPPQSLDVEKSILGSVLIDREAMHKIVDFLSPADFYSRAHQIIYEAMLSLFEKHEPIDVLSLSNNLEEKGCLDDVGGSSYLASLAGSVPTSAHIANYGKIVQRKKMLRDLISAAHDIAGMGHQEDEDIESLLDTAEKKIFSVSQKSLTHSFAR